jgi:hypothetical protein
LISRNLEALANLTLNPTNTRLRLLKDIIDGIFRRAVISKHIIINAGIQWETLLIEGEENNNVSIFATRAFFGTSLWGCLLISQPEPTEYKAR